MEHEDDQAHVDGPRASAILLSRQELRRFFAKIKRAESGCWEWTGVLIYGYGQVRCRTIQYGAHRLSHLAFIGSIPDGYEVDHLCRNPRCINPGHLEAVTPRENNRRSNSASARNARATHCMHGHAFMGNNVRRKSDGSRRCRVCGTLRDVPKAPERRARGRCVQCYRPSDTYRCEQCRMKHNAADKKRTR